MLDQSQSQLTTGDRCDDSPFDEHRDRAGNLRPHWQRYFGYLDKLGETEAKARWTKAKQLLAENGASYNGYGDSLGAERPWRLSPIPLVLGPRDWQPLAQGIAQRARLLSRLLGDLYGPQQSLMEGDLPVELVFDNPNFLRSLHGIGLGKNNWLPLYGVDLIRAPSGRFHVLEDLTQAPAGMGYAIENRIVVAQVLPDLLRECNVERLGSFFRLLRERLQDLAPHNRDAPRIALLTPGPYSPTYFEQAYLAKYLGLTLVHGEDLAVRDARVYLKTLGGLQPIDVLLRRVSDDYCDPLELRPDSELGVPGLVQALRSGNVNTFNPLGTGLLETPALLAYLPGLCRKLLNEELLLTSVPTYYCGDPQQLALVLSEFDGMVIKPTFPVGHCKSTFICRLDAKERTALERQIRGAPERFVAQRFVPSSKTPVISEREVHLRALVLRCFATCGHPSDYQVMPGGLALVATSDADLAVSMHHGARSKDVWALSDEPIFEGTLLPPSHPAIALSRSGGDLASRVADNLYWLGRYAERAEAVARLTRVIGARLLDLPSAPDLARRGEVGRLLAALNHQTHFLDAATTPIDEPSLNLQAAELAFINAVTDAGCAGSVVSAMRAALRTSKVVRDRISHDTWRVLASLDEAIERLQAAQGRDGIARLVNELDHIIVRLAGFSGLVMESMTRGFAWRFLDMGRRLERAMALVTLMRATLVDPIEREAPLLEAVLDVADSGMTYRRRYATSLQTAPTLDLLLADDTNPRSIIFQVQTIREHIGALPPLSTPGVRSNQQRLVLSATSQIELCDVSDLCRLAGDSQRRQRLSNLLQHLAAVLPSLSDSLTETYLYHANVARHLQHYETARAVLANEDEAS
jgi:uncharacterized circularly permuted ATP-grasp superfamily protein/uncharacterized alpha-E superfamily protein